MDINHKQSPTLARHENITHAFFTRGGGFSKGIYASLNCGLGSDDDQNDIDQNRCHVAQSLNVQNDKLIGVYQIHSNRVETIHGARPHASAQKADALVTKSPGLALSIATADCAPVLFCDATASVIGAAHAGWKGAISNVIEETISAMEDLGAKRINICASVGPCISQDAYEVGSEFREQFLNDSTNHQSFFEQGKSQDKWQFDLQGFVLAKLAKANISTSDAIELCTYANEDLFFSYRRTTHKKESDYGRMLSCIVLKERA